MEKVKEYIQKIRAMGKKIALCTSSPKSFYEPAVKNNGIYDLFDNVWSCDDFNTTKADPNIYVMVAEKIGERVEDILFLDDNLNADKTAKQAGMLVCGVYDDSSKEYVDKIKKATDYYIYDFSELLEQGLN